MQNGAIDTDHEFIVAHTSELTLANGTQIRVRPIVPGDKAQLIAGVERLSEESRYRRFLAAAVHLTDAQLVYLTEIDYIDHFAWGAQVILDDEALDGAGVARYVRDPDDPTIAEAAVAVIDEYQGMGIGTVLLGLLTESALENGIERFRAMVAYANHPVRVRLEKLGGRFEATDDGMTAEMPLPPPTGAIVDSVLYDALRAVARGEAGFEPPGAARVIYGGARDSDSVTPYPLLLEPIFKEKVWGGRRLDGYGKQLPPEVLVGESWELADLGTTAPSGGGGDPARSLIRNGGLAGATIHAALERWGAALLGGVPASEAGEFPLLVKYLDARQHLSVQVHPTAGYAAAHPEAFLKSESWYILDAAPGAVIYKGLRPGVTADRLRAAIEDGTVPEVLREIPAIPGECHHLPSGTVHALGAGVLVAEVQTPSDTTFRLYDWAREYGRTGRPLHIAAALESSDFGAPPAATRLEEDVTAGRLVDTEHFWIWAVRASDPPTVDRSVDPTWRVVMAVGGPLRLTIADAVISMGIGDTALIPATAVVATGVTADPGVEYLLIGSGDGPDLGSD